MDAIALLKKDHSAVKKLFGEFSRTTARAEKKRQQLRDRIVEELELHTQIEEQIFYPAMQQVEGAEDLVKEAREEHKEAKELLHDVRGMEPGGDEIKERMNELKDAILHHVKEEEGQMFPKARQLGAEKLQELGEQMDGMKSQRKGGESRGRARRKRAA